MIIDNFLHSTVLFRITLILYLLSSLLLAASFIIRSKGFTKLGHQDVITRIVMRLLAPVQDKTTILNLDHPFIVRPNDLRPLCGTGSG